MIIFNLKVWAIGIVVDIQGRDTHLHIFLGPLDIEIGVPKKSTG